MFPDEEKQKITNQQLYEDEFLDLINKGYNTRSAKRKLRKNKFWKKQIDKGDIKE